MSKKQQHIKNQSDREKETMRMIPGATITWDKSKEEVWSEMEKRMESAEIPDKKVIFAPWVKLAAAAVITLLIGISAFMQLYTKTIRISAGEHSSIYLPDNSQVKLNARSALSYKPFIWKFSRKVKFEGEAYFEVQKGKKFEVLSDLGKTTVLGTSFNIYARKNQYNVTCITGSVKVMERTNRKKVVLSPDQKAELTAKGTLQVISGINTEQTLSWLSNRFSFTSVPVKQVFEEIGRQYNVKISILGNIDKIYTGHFSKVKSADDALNIVCRPLNLNIVRKSQNEYVISGKK